MCIGTLPGRVAPNSDAVNLPLLFVMVMKLVSVLELGGARPGSFNFKLKFKLNLNLLSHCRLNGVFELKLEREIPLIMATKPHKSGRSGFPREMSVSPSPDSDHH